MTVPTRRIGPAALPPTVKSLNYLNNILAKIEARQFGALEAIMLNDQGYVAECTADNMFIVHRATSSPRRPPRGRCKGITRGAIFDIARRAGDPDPGGRPDPLRPLVRGRMLPDRDRAPR